MVSTTHSQCRFLSQRSILSQGILSLNRIVGMLFAGVLVGCADGAPASNREVGAVRGAVLGAGAGAVVGDDVGNTGGGAAIGAAAGGIAGAVIGNAEDADVSHEEYVAQKQELLKKQEKDIERQKREIEDLRRQEFHNDVLRRYED